MTAVCGDGDPRREPRLAAAGADDCAADRACGARSPYLHAADGDPRLEGAAGGDRLLQQQPVEIAARDGPSREAAWIPPFDRHAPLAGDPHPLDAQAPLVDTQDSIDGPTRHAIWQDLINVQLTIATLSALSVKSSLESLPDQGRESAA